MSIALFQEQYASGTGAGTGTASSFNTRLLNTTAINDIVGCSLDASTGIVTLPPGNYWITGSAPSKNYSFSQVRLYDSGNNISLISGTSETNGTTNGQEQSHVSNRSIIDGPLTLTSTTEICLSHFIGAEVGTVTLSYSLGDAVSSGAPELFSTLKIEVM